MRLSGEAPANPGFMLRTGIGLWMVCLLATPQVIGAEAIGFSEGTLNLELRGSEVLNRSGSVVRTLARGQNDPFTGGPIGYTTLLYGSSNDIAANALANAAAPELKYVSHQSEFLFEYGYSSNFGLGFSLIDESLSLKNVRSNVSANQVVLFALSSIYPAGSSGNSPGYNAALIQLELLDPLVHMNRSPYIHATTLNFHTRFHLLSRSRFDPYAALAIGFGLESKLPTYVLRPGVAAGIRFFLGQTTLGFELSRYSLQLGRQSDLPFPAYRELWGTAATASIGIKID